MATFEEHLADALESGQANAGIGVVYTGVTLEELQDAHIDYEFTLESASTEGVDYNVNVDSEPQRVTDSADDRMEAESSDEITSKSDGTWLISGSTGSADGTQAYGDTFSWTSDGDNYGILGFNASLSPSEYTITINGTEVDPVTLPEYEETTGGGGNVLGGGSGYEDTFTQSDADYTVSTRSEMQNALSSASSGEVVFVTSGFDAGSGDFVIPANVTVAGDRGVAGSAGPLIYVDEHVSRVFRHNDNARITGLRIRGVWHDTDYADYQIVYDTGNHTSCGIRFYDVSSAEVDNCEIYGFGFANIVVRGNSDGHIHHNYLHDSNTDGLGYGVGSYDAGTNPTIEYNYFEDNRHSVAAGGNNYGYVCQYNHFGPTQWKHVIDIHDKDGSAATATYIQNNIVEAVEKAAGGTGTAVGGWDTAPEDEIIVSDNWFYLSESEAFADGPMTTQNNYFGTDANVSFDDIIPGHPGPSHTPW